LPWIGILRALRAMNAWRNDSRSSVSLVPIKYFL
jgi:hypothetical protein